MRTWTAAIAACLLTGSIAQAAVTDDLWLDDYDEAVKVAKETGKDVLVDFTGSDWCGWCIRLDEEVFSEQAFQDYAPGAFVLCKLDYPRDPEIQAKVPNPERNDEIRDRYEVRGYPTILLITAEGEELARTGYREGGPESYVEHLKSLRSAGHEAITKVADLMKAYEKAEGEARTEVLKNVVAAYADLHEAAPAAKLRPLVEKAYELDADGKKELRMPALRALLKAGAANAEMATEAERVDPENEKGLYELAVAFHFGQVRDNEMASDAIDRLEDLLLCETLHDKKAIVTLCAMAAGWCANPDLLGEPARAAKIAEKALALGVDDERTRKMLESIVADNGAEG